MVADDGRCLSRPVADWAKATGVGQFLFISSAGIYKPTDEPPHVEGVIITIDRSMSSRGVRLTQAELIPFPPWQDAVKESAGHVGVERYLAEQLFGSWASFRPQYMVGSGNNKDCEEWFFDSNAIPAHS